MTILERLIDLGEIELKKDASGKWYCGKAADGVEIKIGELGQESIINEYLKTHASPRDW